MQIIASDLYYTSPGMTEAIEQKDLETIQRTAKKIEESGADFIKLGVPKLGDKQKENDLLIWLVSAVQDVSDLPLAIKWCSLEGFGDVLKVVKRPGIVLGICKEAFAKALFPYFKDLALGWRAMINIVHDSGQEAGQSLLAYQNIVREAGINGLTPERIIFDPCANSLKETPRAYLNMEEYIDAFSNDYDDAAFCVDAYRLVEGIDKPELLKTTFLVLSLGLGVEYITCLVEDKEVRDAFFAASALFDEQSGLSEYEKYINA